MPGNICIPKFYERGFPYFCSYLALFSFDLQIVYISFALVLILNDYIKTVEVTLFGMIFLLLFN